MPTYDPRIDAYIEKAGDFAKPVLRHIRDLVHKADPRIEETVKWGMPFFEYKGPICMMAAFKAHCSFGFWKSSRLNDPAKMLHDGEPAAGSFGRIEGLESLPPDDALIGFIHQSIAINESGVKEEKKPAKVKAEIPMPEDFDNLLANNLAAKTIYEKFSPSHKREYLEWIVEAKTEATRQKRLAQAIEMITEGKSKNWKYQR